MKVCILLVYSLQEDPLVHLLWSGPNAFFLFSFAALAIHTASKFISTRLSEEEKKDFSAIGK